MPTTPFGYRLASELDNEFERMRNQWFFKWHALGYGGRVVVDNFDGQQISYEGIRYKGSPPTVFWDAVRRYLLNKVNKTFELAENEIRIAGVEHAGAIADDAAAALQTFCGRIVHAAEETDRSLKGGGLQSHGAITPHAEIEQRKRILVQFFLQEANRSPSPSRQVLELRPGIWGMSVDLKEIWRRVRQWWRNRA
jgi:hypothetical protein